MVTNTRTLVRPFDGFKGIPPDGGPFPDPMEPGQFKDTWDANDEFKARWASHADVVEQVLRGRYDLLTPKGSEFIPTLGCPYRCRTCPYKGPKLAAGAWELRDTPQYCVEIPVGLAQRYLEKLRDGGCRALLFTGGGEPTYHPHLGKILRAAKERGFRLALSTNGTFLRCDLKPEEVVHLGLDFVRVSINTFRRHAQWHGYAPRLGYLDLVTDNLREILRAKTDSGASTRVVACFLFSADNVEEIPEMGREVAGRFPGLDGVVIRPVQDYWGDDHVSRDVIHRAKELIRDHFRPTAAACGIAVHVPQHRLTALRPGVRPYSACRGCGLIGGLWPNGEMYICTECNGFRDFCIGDLAAQSVPEVYRSDRCREVREHAGQTGFHDCPVVCRPTRLNEVFQKIEDLRAENGTAQVERWLLALQARFPEPNPWIGVA